MKGEIVKQDQKIAVLLEEIKTLRKLSKMLTEDQMAQKEVTKRKLAMQEKQSCKKRRYEALKKVRAMRQVDFPRKWERRTRRQRRE